MTVELTNHDQEFFERELASFLPDKIFDAHVHLWSRADEEHLQAGLPPVCGYDEYRRMIDWLHPGRWAGGLFLSFPYTGTARQANEWIARQAARNPSCRGTLFVAPDDDPEWIRGQAKRLGAVGFKCYHASATSKYNWEADIPDYLPEPIVAVAHQEGWTITLHLVKSRAVADPANIHWIKEYCRKYPNMRLILAHCGRAFQPAHALEGLPQLVGLDNLYFDSSANCEPIAHEAVIRFFGHRKLLHGTDGLSGSHYRGRTVGVADSFIWLCEDAPVWNEKHARISPVLVGLENLRALKWACWSAKLTDRQVEDIFWNNAAELFSLD